MISDLKGEIKYPDIQSYKLTSDLFTAVWPVIAAIISVGLAIKVHAVIQQGLLNLGRHKSVENMITSNRDGDSMYHDDDSTY